MYEVFVKKQQQQIASFLLTAGTIYTSLRKAKPWAQPFYLTEITHHFFNIAPDSIEIWFIILPPLASIN